MDQADDVDTRDDEKNFTPQESQYHVVDESEKDLLRITKVSRDEWVKERRMFRARAHSNPLNDGAFSVPAGPVAFREKCSKVYGNSSTPCTWVDIGCGYGGLLATLSVAYPDVNMCGLEIRERVADYCLKRLSDLSPAHSNVHFERTNAMKFLPYYFSRASLDKLFFCYPDPHFKRRKNRQRVISVNLLSEYAYVLREGTGIAYIVTDVPELFVWIVPPNRKSAPKIDLAQERIYIITLVIGDFLPPVVDLFEIDR